MDIVTYALARKYVQQTANSLGAVRGAPCTIQTITETDKEIVVIFSWTGTDGTSQTSTMNIPKGEDGYSPTAKVTKTGNKTTISITDKNGTTTADVLDGKTYSTSNTKPTNTGTVGDIVLNSLPQPSTYIGWVYTPLGWFGFGLIEDAENEDNTFITSDNYKIQTVDGDIFCYKTT